MDFSTHHILVCDDELDVRDMVQEYLKKRGFNVSTAANANELRLVLSVNPIDLIILDINMPGEDGLATLRSLRQEQKMVPVVMLTAAGETVDRIIGLEMGADDYLGKPVDLRELEARVKAVLRRPQDQEQSAQTEKSSDKVQFGDFTIDFPAGQMFGPDNEIVPLTAMEFDLLRVFADNKGRVLNRDQILESAHDRSWDPFDRSIDIRISRLRKKIERNPEKPAIIKTVRGLGYVFDPKDT